MNPYKGIENRLDKLISVLEQLAEAIKVVGTANTRASAPAPKLCGARHGNHECDLPAGHKPS